MMRLEVIVNVVKLAIREEVLVLVTVVDSDVNLIDEDVLENIVVVVTNLVK